jgi:hypothetical protein
MKHTQVNLLALALLLLLCQGCISRQRLKTYLWLNNTPLPKDICEREPELKEYGFYRKLNDGTFEFVTFCGDKAKDFFAIYKKDLETILNGEDKPTKGIFQKRDSIYEKAEEVEEIRP